MPKIFLPKIFLPEILSPKPFKKYYCQKYCCQKNIFTKNILKEIFFKKLSPKIFLPKIFRKKYFCQKYFQKKKFTKNIFEKGWGKAPLLPAGPRLISSDSEISAQCYIFEKIELLQNLFSSYVTHVDIEYLCFYAYLFSFQIINSKIFKAPFMGTIL